MLAASEGKTHALILLLVTTGLRISEALDARWNHLYADPHGSTGLRVAGRGAKVRDVQILPAVVEALKPFRTGPAGYLIPNDKGARLSQQAADQAIARAAQRAGIDKQVSAHRLRHYLANGADLLQVQKDLGHAALATIQRYLHAAKGLDKTSADFAAGGLL